MQRFADLYGFFRLMDDPDPQRALQAMLGAREVLWAKGTGFYDFGQALLARGFSLCPADKDRRRTNALLAALRQMDDDEPYAENALRGAREMIRREGKSFAHYYASLFPEGCGRALQKPIALPNGRRRHWARGDRAPQQPQAETPRQPPFDLPPQFHVAAPKPPAPKAAHPPQPRKAAERKAHAAEVEGSVHKAFLWLAILVGAFVFLNGICSGAEKPERPMHSKAQKAPMGLKLTS